MRKQLCIDKNYCIYINYNYNYLKKQEVKSANWYGV